MTTDPVSLTVMRRFLLVLVLLAIPAVVVAAPSVYDQVWGDRVDARLCVLEAEAGIVSPECAPDTTTTTQATTTTTEATTTTTAPGLTIPPTLPYPARGSGIPYADGGGFDFMLINADTGVTWWVAKYWGSNGLPYDSDDTSLDGDREGYRCGYGFYGTADGLTIDGRFAFVRPPGQAYGKVNDKYMDEAVRYLDGTPTNTAGNEIPDEDCTDVLSDIDYAGACRPVDERPRIAFFDGFGQVIDIRDYTQTDANNIVFNLHSFDGKRATVLACEDGLVGLVVYYDALGDGSIAVELDGAMVSP